MNPGTKPPELDSLEREAAHFFERCEKRTKGAGAMSCSGVLGFFILLLAVGAMRTTGGWIMLFVGTVMLFGLTARNAARKSVTDFQQTFRVTGGDSARRDAALAYLWKRAHPDSSKLAPSKAAVELLKELGVKSPPRGALRARPIEHAEPAGASATTEESPPWIAAPVARPGHDPRPAAPPPHPTRADERHPAPTPAATPRTTAAPVPPARTPFAAAGRREGQPPNPHVAGPSAPGNVPPTPPTSPRPTPPATPAWTPTATRSATPAATPSAMPSPMQSATPSATSSGMPSGMPPASLGPTAGSLPPPSSRTAGTSPTPASDAFAGETVLVPSTVLERSFSAASTEETLAERPLAPRTVSTARDEPLPWDAPAPPRASFAPSDAAKPAELSASGPASKSDSITLVCDYCGRSREVERAAASALCPHCFPQIRLDV